MVTVLYILCLLRNEGFPSFCVPFCFVYSSEGQKGASPPFETLMTTVGRMVFPAFDVCVWDERDVLCLVRLFLWIFFQPHTFQQW